MTNAWRLGRVVAAALAVGGLTACAAANDPRGARSELAGLFAENSADRALAAVTRGDYSSAESHALAALRRDPKDPFALLAAGLAYQGTGRYDLARQYYDVILTNQNQGTLMVPGEGGGMESKSIIDVARSNLAVIDKITGRTVPRTIAQSGKPPGVPAVGLPPMGAPAPRVAVSAAGFDPLPSAPPSGQSEVQPPGVATEAETNVAGRFRILKRLLDEGLVTPAEYSTRRQNNLGALLPYTHPTPGQGLERPIPRDDAVVERLKALAAALEGRAMSAREHAAERTTILDALLPADPKRIDLPVLPPRDMIEAGAAVGRMERMRAAGLVSSEEADKERAAVEKAYERSLAAARVDGSATGLRHGKPEPIPAGAWGVHLASLKSEAAARKSWDALKAKFGDQLGMLELKISKVTLKGKGTRWRVLAGPVAGKEAALQTCKALKLHRQFCDPAKME